jgi:glyoxylase-like metal-dependent hydrolase (beta-lactamase superfamily II)
MEQELRQFRVGAATVTVIKDGDWLDSRTWAEEFDVPEEAWRHAGYAAELSKPFEVACYCFHVALPGASILVDAGFGDRLPSFKSVEVRHGLSIPDGLARIGVKPEEITHIVITHAHIDHLAGVTVERNGALVPQYPNARCYVGRADWEQNPQRETPDSLPNRTFGVLEPLGLLDLVDGDRDIAPGVRMIHTPGETPGHSILRVQSGDEILYVLGDLYHHPVEVERPEWGLKWRNHAANLTSRNALATAAVAEGALLLASHIPGTGRLQPTGAGGVVWVTPKMKGKPDTGTPEVV